MTPAASPQEATTQPEATARQFVGTWRLLDYSFLHDDGVVERPWGTDVRGYLLYSAEGYMSGNLSPARHKRGISERAGAGATRRSRRYIAYTGRYTVEGSKVIHHVEASLFPNWVGRSEIRFYSFEGDRLILRTGPIPSGKHTVVAQLIWQRVKGDREG
jgi:hypothetical protein